MNIIIFNKKIGIFCVNFYELVFVFIFFLGVILDGGKCYIQIVERLFYIFMVVLELLVFEGIIKENVSVDIGL